MWNGLWPNSSQLAADDKPGAEGWTTDEGLKFLVQSVTIALGSERDTETSQISGTLGPNGLVLPVGNAKLKALDGGRQDS
jgi:hypothetical protein